MKKERERKTSWRADVRRWVSRIGGRGRVVVPAELRGALSLKEGDAVVFEATGGAVTFKPQAEVVRARRGVPRRAQDDVIR